MELGLDGRALLERPQLLIAPTADFAREAAFPGAEQKTEQGPAWNWPQTSCSHLARQLGATCGCLEPCLVGGRGLFPFQFSVLVE